MGRPCLLTSWKATIALLILRAGQVHIRHLVGGRARGDQHLSNERLFTVAGPERLGAVSHLPSTIKLSAHCAHIKVLEQTL